MALSSRPLREERRQGRSVRGVGVGGEWQRCRRRRGASRVARTEGVRSHVFERSEVGKAWWDGAADGAVAREHAARGAAALGERVAWGVGASVLEALTCTDGGEGNFWLSHSIQRREVGHARWDGAADAVAHEPAARGAAALSEKVGVGVGGSGAGGADVHRGRRGQWLGSHKSVSEVRLAKPDGMVPLTPVQ
jgi:hypothetical protein